MTAQNMGSARCLNPIFADFANPEGVATDAPLPLSDSIYTTPFLPVSLKYGAPPTTGTLK